jgi:hypothetical protein
MPEFMRPKMVERIIISFLTNRHQPTDTELSILSHTKH